MPPTPRPAPQRRLAVLADADSMSSPKLLPQMLAAVREEGRPIIRRAFGDWTEQKLAPWKAVLHEHAFHPRQQFRYVTRGNATDSALIVDAMDILRDGKVDGFCLIASDSDYTRLVTRLQEDDMFVMGIGAPDANPALRKACDRFVGTDLLARPAVPEAKAHGAPKATPAPGPAPAGAARPAAPARRP